MNGFLVIDKSSGMSSYDVIRRLKALHRFTKIGYIGTLDRNATGVLPVAIDAGVKLIPFLEDGEKMYTARFLLGVTTDTYDIEGKVLSQVEPEHFDLEKMVEILATFQGRISQQIPLYSSKKVNRKPLYKWAREGVVMEPHSKEVQIFQIKVLDYSHPYLDLEVTCSKGTYIRTLANDFGGKLGCGATLHSLKRTKHGEFSEDMGHTIESFKSDQDLLNYIIPLEKILKNSREMVVETALERFVNHGMPIPLLGDAKGWNDGDLVKMLTKRGTLFGVGAVDAASRTIKVKRLINT
jgi:tRNA pseudouridine55 synthase